MVPAGPSAALVESYAREGIPYAVIARAAGVQVSSVRNLDRRRKIHRSTAEALAAVKIEPAECKRRDGVRRSAAGTCRRARALARCGWTFRAIASIAGVDHSSIRSMMYNEPSRINLASAGRVQAAFETLAGHWAGAPGTQVTAGHAIRARDAAIGRGYLPWWAWEDIDDPQCEPVAWHTSAELQAVDLSWVLAEQGFSRDYAVRVTAVRWKTLAEYHRRMGRPIPEVWR